MNSLTCDKTERVVMGCWGFTMTYYYTGWCISIMKAPMGECWRTSGYGKRRQVFHQNIEASSILQVNELKIQNFPCNTWTTLESSRMAHCSEYVVVELLPFTSHICCVLWKQSSKSAHIGFSFWTVVIFSTFLSLFVEGRSSWKMGLMSLPELTGR